MKHRTITVIAMIFASLFCMAAGPVEKKEAANAAIVINADMGKDKISRHIYGQFAEHLGHGIYGGIWVGEESAIPNTNGIRNDVVEALRKLSIPNLRWPGGCFADEYHWMDGIGPRAERPKMVNTNWGGVTEDNSFGTHEFMELCEQLGTEPVICGNVGSGSVEEMSKWVEYLNFDGISPMADLRRVNGREEPWNVKYWGVGNENWGCGGRMRPEFYADQYRRYATFCKNYGQNRLRKIAGGAGGDDYQWTETLMKEIPLRSMWGLSLHHYTTTTWHGDRGTATEFGEPEYFNILRLCLDIEEVLDRHIAIMDRYDPQKWVALVVDEWGTWHDVEPGTNPGFLFQQNTLRDAMVAALSLNYFNERSDRIRMANIAQMVNVLQSMILTDEEKMIVTPTYHVFEMYKVHQDATLLPLSLVSVPVYRLNGEEIPAISASASRDGEGKIHISLVNINPDEDSKVSIDLRGQEVSAVTGRILTADELTAHNTFDRPDAVQPGEFKQARVSGNMIRIDLPARSVVVLELD